MTDYEYTKVNRLNEPHNYMYTAYQGSNFLEEYLSERLKCLKILKKVGIKNYKNKNFLSECPRVVYVLEEALEKEFDNEHLKSVIKLVDNIKLDTSCYYNTFPLLSFSSDNSINSQDLLESLLNSQIKNEDENLIKFWLDLIVQRFEVTKKLYEIYPINFRKGKGKGNTVYLYEVFAISLALFYIANKNLKYLNALLKVTDLLCSIGDKTQGNNIYSHCFSLVLLIEISIIKSLTKNIEEVNFEFT
jgi:hypothetical protein